MQVCVWEGTLVGTENVKEFEKWLTDEFGVKGKYLEEVQRKDSEQIDLLFTISDEDISKFTIPRLKYGIRWWEDVLNNCNYSEYPYPKKVLEKYPKTW